MKTVRKAVDMGIPRSAEAGSWIFPDRRTPAWIGRIRVKEMSGALDLAFPALCAPLDVIKHHLKMRVWSLGQALPCAEIVDCRKLGLLIDDALNSVWKSVGRIKL